MSLSGNSIYIRVWKIIAVAQLHLLTLSIRENNVYKLRHNASNANSLSIHIVHQTFIKLQNSGLPNCL